MKKIWLIFLVLFLTGCSVNYELDIDNSAILRENIKISANNDSDIEKIKEFNYYVPIDYTNDDYSVYEKKFDKIEYYDVSKASDNKSLVFKYDKYDSNKFNYNMFGRTCYKYVAVMEQKDKKSKKRELLLSTSRQFLCFDNYENLDEVNVIIKSKYKLLETNADVQEKHKYIWNITKENANNKYIYLLLDLKTRELTLWERIQEGEYVNMFTISLVLFLVGLVIWFLFKKKGDIKNKV